MFFRRIKSRGLAHNSYFLADGGEAVVVDPRREATRSLLRIGYDEVEGYLRGGFEAWQNAGRPLGRLETIDTTGLRSRRRSDALEILDVRKPSKWDEGTIEGARTIFVGDLERRVEELPDDVAYVTMCSVGHRGGLAASILARHGRRACNYPGGYTAWKETAAA